MVDDSLLTDELSNELLLLLDELEPTLERGEVDEVAAEEGRLKEERSGTPPAQEKSNDEEERTSKKGIFFIFMWH